MTEDFHTIPNFPNYEINRLGVVRNKTNGYNLKVRRNGNCRDTTLYKDGRPHDISVEKLLRLVFRKGISTGKTAPIPGFPDYVISCAGVVWSNLSHKKLVQVNGSVSLVNPRTKQRRKFAVNNLLFLVFGKIRSKFLPTPVTLCRKGRQIYFETKTQAARWLAETCYYSAATMADYLGDRRPVICGWQVNYFDDEKLHVPTTKKINTLAKKQRKVHRDALQQQAERSRH